MGSAYAAPMRKWLPMTNVTLDEQRADSSGFVGRARATGHGDLDHAPHGLVASAVRRPSPKWDNSCTPLTMTAMPNSAINMPATKLK